MLFLHFPLHTHISHLRSDFVHMQSMPPMQAEIDAARDELKAAIDGLVINLVDKSRLERLVKEAKKYEEPVFADVFAVVFAPVLVGVLPAVAVLPESLEAILSSFLRLSLYCRHFALHG